MKTYEGMFLLDAGISEFETASEPIRQVLTRVQAEVINLRPWDERRLAYAIDGRKRALYVLTYFKADPARLGELEHEIGLNEGILRAMLLSADHLSEDKISAETPATLQHARRAAAEARKAEEAAAETRKAEEAKDEAKAEKAEAVAAEVLEGAVDELKDSPDEQAGEKPTDHAPGEAPADEAPEGEKKKDQK